MKPKSPIVAFLLSVIPGLGHAYLGRFGRFVLYGGGFFIPMGLLFLLVLSGNTHEDEIVLLLLFAAAAAWVINIIDMVLSLIRGPAPGLRHAYDGTQPPEAYASAAEDYLRQRERTHAMLLSFIPGLGHMSLGLMQRGLTFLAAYFGVGISVIFITAVSNIGAFLVFLLVLPVIWIYCMFDVSDKLQRKQRGETLADRSLFEDLEGHMGAGRKSRVLGVALSIFPGAGHLYLGLSRRGIQLMGGFLLAIYLMDTLRLTLFFILLPLFWFYAFFDAYHYLSRYGREPLKDEPVVSYLAPHQRWIGYALVLVGAYYLIDRVILQALLEMLPKLRGEYYKIRYYFPTAIVSFLLIAGGLKLLMGPRRDAYEDRDRTEPNGGEAGRE
ncbi:hypothetical protein ACFQWB_04820 [Paenibacillus thermoaerophilus]|uniref:Multi-TM2 domain-containing protein n=1 Tax=Paenibacillus thermoaerophilus TaxID=1215385 RepID=A0ABW2V1A0_9BACL|nr:hypothetical protein [Paenibacillus thermoaerophilus]